ncbi:MAG: PepSY domain-containing protein [Tenacibaculum sp.]
MTISIWRYSHLTLAISSFVFVCLAAITGIILAFEPISNQLKPYAIHNTHQISIAQTLASLKKEYKEVVTITVNTNNFIAASVITQKGNNETFYINPSTAKKISNLQPKPAVYKFVTNLHRSLFLKSTGRFLVGFFSFLLFLITVTGSILLIKRQGGILRFFTKVINENFNLYYHVVLSRYFLIPILILSLTGVYLSAEKFSLLPKHNIKHNYNFTSSSTKKISIENFPVFKQNKLSDLKSIEFPFSEDEEDYFLVKLHNKELLIHQYTGEVVSNQPTSFIKKIANWSLFLHTGSGSILWSIILLLTCCSILFFVYSGFAISLKRRKQPKLPKNKFTKNNAEIIILVGSESGSTYNFAIALYKALIKANKKVYLNQLNKYTTYQNATHLLILTATYGDGEAPTNATNFLVNLNKVSQPNNLNYAIVGFGSYAYTHFCKFAIAIADKLNTLPNFSPTIPLTKINNQSFADFKKWSVNWCNKTQIALDIQQEKKARLKEIPFKVISKTELNIDASFLIRLQPSKKIKYQSGDLLAITPKKDNVTRLYSIGKIEDDILLSIKKYELGICSTLLNNLVVNETIQATIKKNKDFHFPKKNKEVILIANGTGIAPFLGMLNHKTKTHVLLGLRTKASLEMYKPYLKNTNYKIAFSQEGKKQYVQNIVLEESKLIANVLNSGGILMICGSVSMMNGVLLALEKITTSELNTPLEVFKNKNQLKTDCY